MLYGFVVKEETPELHAFIESHCRNLIAEPIGSLHCFCNCTILRKAVENAISSDCWLCFCLFHKWTSTLHYVGWFGSAEGAWVVVQVYESNHSDKQSSRLNMWSHPDAVASSVHQQQEMQWAKERPIVKKICHLFFFSWYVISEHHLTVNCDQSASLWCLLTSSTKDNIEQITLHV